MSRFGLLRLCKNFCTHRPIRLYSSGHHDHPHWLSITDKPTMNAYYDDAFTPEGEYQEHFNRLNSRYNMYLAGSVAFFFVAVTAFLKLGCLQYNVLNYPKFENTPEGLEFYEVGRKHFTEMSDQYAAENNPALKAKEK